jgi:hypothetical protein
MDLHQGDPYVLIRFIIANLIGQAERIVRL